MRGTLLEPNYITVSYTGDFETGDLVLVSAIENTTDTSTYTVGGGNSFISILRYAFGGITFPGTDGQLPPPTSQYQIGREGNQIMVANYDLVVGHGATVDWDHYGPSHYLGEHPRSGETVVAYEAGANFVNNDYYWNTVYERFRVYITVNITGWFNYGSPLGWIGQFPGENQATAAIAERTSDSITAQPPIAEWHNEVWTVDPDTFVEATEDYVELHWFPAFQQREHRVSYWYGYDATIRWPAGFPYSGASRDELHH